MPPLTQRWALTIGRLEGLSFVALLGVAMPLKYLGGIAEATQWAGWVHGFLFLAFLVALASARRVGQWPLWWLGLGYVASVIPLGTFVFEYWLRTKLDPSGAPLQPSQA